MSAITTYKGFYIFKITRNTYAISKVNDFSAHINMFGSYPKTIKAEKAAIDELV